ncbi:hypothetical protein Tco_0672118 [Tanacetum coccineum]
MSSATFSLPTLPSTRLRPAKLSWELIMRGYLRSHIPRGIVTRIRRDSATASSSPTITRFYTRSRKNPQTTYEFPALGKALPPIDSPTAESPGYITESDPEEDPEGYEDDETEDGPVDYPMDGGDDGDDDDGDSSRDDARDEDEDEEDEEDEEEEEHLAPADSTTVIPADEPVSPPEGTEPAIPPPSTDITIGARITVRPQASISLPPEAEVERLLTMTTPSPSPPISLSPPSAGERLARCMAPPAHSPPLPPSSGCLTQIQTLRIASTQALIDAVTAYRFTTTFITYSLRPSLSIPAPMLTVRDDILVMSSTPRRVDAEERGGSGIRDVGYGDRILGYLLRSREDTQDLYCHSRGLLRDGRETSMDGGGGCLCFPDESWARSIGCSQADSSGQELQTHRDHVYAHETYLQAHQTQLQLQSTLIQTQHQVHETRFQMQHTELAALRETDRRRQDQMVEALRVIRDMRREMSDMQAELLALREPQRRARQPGPEARIPDHQEASGDADSHI